MDGMKKKEYLDVARSAIKLTIEKADENDELLVELAALRADNDRLTAAMSTLNQWGFSVFEKLAAFVQAVDGGGPLTTVLSVRPHGETDSDGHPISSGYGRLRTRGTRQRACANLEPTTRG